MPSKRRGMPAKLRSYKAKVSCSLYYRALHNFVTVLFLVVSVPRRLRSPPPSLRVPAIGFQSFMNSVNFMGSSASADSGSSRVEPVKGAGAAVAAAAVSKLKNKSSTLFAR